MDQPQKDRETRRHELEQMGPQKLLRLAHQKGINLLNGPFVIETILDEEFPRPRDLEQVPTRST